MRSFEEVVARTRRSVVRITSGQGSGAGTVLGEGGFILTNAHVAAVGPLAAEAADGAVHPASLFALDRGRDLALLAAPHLKAPPLSLAPRGSGRPGQLMIAVGHPSGGAIAASTGIIVGADQDGCLPVPQQRLLLSDLRLAPGFSGGPMVDAEGRVLALSTLIWSGVAAGIPADSVRRFLTEVAAEVLDDPVRPHDADSRPRGRAG